MTPNMTREQIDALWKEGYRPWEIYTTNKQAVEYCGETMAPDTIPGWEIEHVFAKRDSLNSYPFFDCIICKSDLSIVETVHLS
jgi:hypothetical protein